MTPPTPATAELATEQRFQTLFEQAPFSAQLLSVDGRTLKVNQAWKDLWGAQDGDPLLEWVLSEYNMLADPQLQAKGVTPHLLKAFAGASVRLPISYYDPAELGKPGNARWVEATARPIKDAEGRVIEVMLIHEDVTVRLLAEQQLRASEMRLRQLANTIPQMAWIADAQGAVNWYNDRWYEYTGATPKDMVGWGWQGVMDEQALPEVLEKWRHSLATSEPFQMTFPIRRRDGEYRPFFTLVAPLRDDAGKVVQWFGTNTDVTPLQEAERARQEIERRNQGERERLARLFEQAPSFMALLDGPTHRFVLANPKYTQLVGREVIGQTLAEALPDAAAQGYLELLDRVYQSGEPYSAFESRYEMQASPDVAAVEQFVDFVIQPIRDEAGAVSGIFVQGVDVTERVRTATQRAVAEKALRESEAKFRTIADAMPQMVWSTLPDGYHDYYNQQWYDFTGAPPGSTDGEGWNRMFHPEDQAHAWEVWRHSLATGDTYEIEYRLRHRSGEYRWVLGRALPVRSDKGAIVRWMGTCTDIHEHKRAQEELLANNRRKDDFLAMLAHELRNPLAPISTAAHLLKAAPLDRENVERSADIVSRQVRHMTELVDDLLDVSRVTRGLVELERKPVELKAVLGNAIEQVRPLIEARGHELTTRMASGDVLVLGDRTRLVQVVSNLLNNSAKYTPVNGSLSLSMTVGEFVEVRVADNGMGIDAQLLPHVFDLFTQGERTPDRSQGGLGLGLALVKSLVELHGGRVMVESEGRGRGSAFTVTLPLLTAAPAEPPPVPQRIDNPPASPSRRVMVVDDNKDAAETLGMLLESLGHEVRVAHDPEQALQVVRDAPRDVFILDIGLPGMDGYALARELRAHPNGSAATYIALTGYGSTQDKQRGDAAGFAHYLVKPADLGDLVRLLQPADRCAARSEDRETRPACEQLEGLHPEQGVPTGLQSR